MNRNKKQLRKLAIEEAYNKRQLEFEKSKRDESRFNSDPPRRYYNNERFFTEDNFELREARVSSDPNVYATISGSQFVPTSRGRFTYSNARIFGQPVYTTATTLNEEVPTFSDEETENLG